MCMDKPRLLVNKTSAVALLDTRVQYMQEVLQSCFLKRHCFGVGKPTMPCNVLVLACEELSSRSDVSESLKGHLLSVIRTLPSTADERGNLRTQNALFANPTRVPACTSTIERLLDPSYVCCSLSEIATNSISCKFYVSSLILYALPDINMHVL
jgi:hypothetical protein